MGGRVHLSHVGQIGLQPEGDAMPQQTLPRVVTLILALTLATSPLFATPAPLAHVPGLLATFWQSLFDVILPDLPPSPVGDPEPTEQPKGDLGPTLDPIG